MGCIRVTPRPSYYRELAQAIQIPPEEPVLEDKITVCFRVSGIGGQYQETGSHPQCGGFCPG